VHPIRHSLNLLCLTSPPTTMPPRPYTSQELQSSAVSRARLNLHHSTSSSRDGRHANNNQRDAVEQPHVLSRFLSNCSSRHAMPQRHHPNLQHLNSSLSLNRFLVPVTASQHGVMKGRSPGADLQDRTLPPIYDRSDWSSLDCWSATSWSAPSPESCLWGGNNERRTTPRRTTQERKARP
jgi:hypothetical protein